MKKKKIEKSPFNTTRDFIEWAADSQEYVSKLQDVCLDHFDTSKREEVIEILKELTELKNEIAIFQEECDNAFQQIISNK